MFSSTYDTITTTTLIIRLLFAIGGMFLWGYVCKHIVRSKGYPDSENKGFWWGFFLGWIGIIVCVTKKPYNNPMNQFGQFDQFNQYGQGGFNNYGQLGDGTNEKSYVPKKVESLEHVKAVDVGAYHTAAITENGDLYVWGANDKYQLGDGYTVSQPNPMKLMENVKQISLGNNACLALTEDGRIYTWGQSVALGYSAEKNTQHTPQEIEVFLYKLLGDYDGDDNITSDDALAVLRLSIGLETIDDDDERTFPVSDYDKDDELTSNDAMLILRVSVGY